MSKASTQIGNSVACNAGKHGSPLQSLLAQSVEYLVGFIMRHRRSGNSKRVLILTLQAPSKILFNGRCNRRLLELRLAVCIDRILHWDRSIYSTTVLQALPRSKSRFVSRYGLLFDGDTAKSFLKQGGRKWILARQSKRKSHQFALLGVESRLFCT